jgi:predicted ABC-type transport system involved in lysophospholipase L1 biosynthesis ATPase subunit
MRISGGRDDTIKLATFGNSVAGGEERSVALVRRFRDVMTIVNNTISLDLQTSHRVQEYMCETS